VTLARWFSFLVFAGAVHSAEVVADQSTHKQILSTLFPNAKIESQRGVLSRHRSSSKPPGSQLDFPDALAEEPVYRVRGQGQDDDERCASENMGTGAFSDVRDLRMKVWRWPGFKDRSHFLVLVHYSFVGAAPAGSCWSVARLLHLKRSESGFETVGLERLNLMHHSGFQLARSVDLDGDGIDELVIEVDWGGAGMVGSTLKVFDLQGGRLNLWLDLPSRLFESSEEIQQYVQVLDIQRTRRERAAQFCFKKTVFAAGDHWLPKPEVTRPCFKRYEGSASTTPPK
jgi:hypothetical protein